MPDFIHPLQCVKIFLSRSTTPPNFNRTLIRPFIMKYKLKMQFCFTELFLMVVLNCFMISLGNHMHKLIFDKWIIYNFDLSKVLIYINKGIHIIINKHTINPFSTNVPLLYPLLYSTSITLFLMFSGGYRSGTLV